MSKEDIFTTVCIVVILVCIFIVVVGGKLLKGELTW